MVASPMVASFAFWFCVLVLWLRVTYGIEFELREERGEKSIATIAPLIIGPRAVTREPRHFSAFNVAWAVVNQLTPSLSWG